MGYGNIFQGLVVRREVKSHTRDEVQDSGVDSPAMEALQSEVKRHPVNLDHHKRHPRQGIVAFLSEWTFLLVVLAMVAIGALMMFGILKP